MAQLNSRVSSVDRQQESDSPPLAWLIGAQVRFPLDAVTSRNMAGLRGASGQIHGPLIRHCVDEQEVPQWQQMVLLNSREMCDRWICVSPDQLRSNPDGICREDLQSLIAPSQAQPLTPAMLINRIALLAGLAIPQDDRGRKAIMKAVGFRKPAWAYLCRHGAAWIRPLLAGDDHLDRQHEDLYWLFGLLSESGYPAPPPGWMLATWRNFLCVVVERSRRAVRISQLGNRRLFEIMLQEWPQRMSDPGFREELNLVIYWMAVADPPLDANQRRRGWAGLLGRAQHWLKVNLARSAASHRKLPIAGPAFEAGRRCALPITHVGDLVECGFALRNCLVGSSDRFVSDRASFFRLVDNGKTVGIAMFEQGDDRWCQARALGFANAPLSDAWQAFVRAHELKLNSAEVFTGRAA